jgi:hypothetical protein
MMPAEKNNTSKSWWGYGVAAVYTIFAVATLGFVAFTMTQKVELVAPDYYAKELAYEAQLERLRQGNALAEQVSCQLSIDGRFIEVRFPESMTAARGNLTLYRPSASALDREFALAPDAAGVQRIPAENLTRGLWRVKLAWQANAEEYYREFMLHVAAK